MSPLLICAGLFVVGALVAIVIYPLFVLNARLDDIEEQEKGIRRS